jgi:hypothetical protein
MSVSYEIRLLSPTGRFLKVLDEFDNLTLARRVNDVGSFSIDLPYSLWRYVARDSQFEVYRSIDKGPNRLLGGTRWFARKFVRKGIGSDFTVSGMDANDLLRRLIVAFPVASSQANKSAAIDDMLKEIVYENLLYNGAVLPPRGFNGVSVEANSSAAPVTTKAFSRRNALDVMKELAATSAQLGTYLAFDIQLLSDGTFQFRTFTGQRGRDRRDSLTLSEENGTLSDATRTDDYTDEATVVYAGGTGQEAARLVGESWDSDRLLEAPFNYIEKWVDSRNTNDTYALNDEAWAELRNSRPRKILEGTLIDSAKARYGRDYDFGDIVTAVYDYEAFPVRLDAFTLDYSGGNEQIKTALYGEL